MVNTNISNKWIYGEIRFAGSAVNELLSENQSCVTNYKVYKQYAGCNIEV